MALCKFFLAIFAFSCLIHTTPALTVTPDNKGEVTDAPHKPGEGGPWPTAAAAAAATAEELQEEEGEGGIVMDSSKIRLGTRKLLRRQANRLVRARREPAEKAPSNDATGDTSNEDNEDPLPNYDQSRRDSMSCVSQKANNTIPAAHIRGHGTRPFAHQPVNVRSLVKGYQQRWQCCEHSGHAFVDGGMVFNQTDKSLRVPTCGYYHVFSQIYYHIAPSTSTSTNKSVYHLLKFSRNCPSWGSTDQVDVTVIGKSSVSHDDTTSYTSDVVRLCSGGKVWVEIPDLPGAPCCPIGDEQGTFISAYLVAETTCHWPPDITMSNMKE